MKDQGRVSSANPSEWLPKEPAWKRYDDSYDERQMEQQAWLGTSNTKRIATIALANQNRSPG